MRLDRSLYLEFDLDLEDDLDLELELDELELLEEEWSREDVDLAGGLVSSSLSDVVLGEVTTVTVLILDTR